jgi:septum formation inhibitor-activating ATPase MinD
MSDKNGTGKTTFTCNISILLASKNFKVGIIEFGITNYLTKNYEMIPDEVILKASWEWNPLK